MSETWKDIPGYEGLYQVSNTGRVKSLERFIVRNGVTAKIPERMLKFNIVGYGYCKVNLFKNGVRSPCLVHRLVADAFLQNQQCCKEVNHIDGDKRNNRAENLEFCTRSENMSHAYKTGLRKTIQVAQYDKDMNLIKVYDSISEAAEGRFHHADISKCCKGKLKTVGGYIWKYV